MLNVSIRAAAPQILRRPLIYVDPKHPLVHAATFLAIGPQIYVDGLVVIHAEKLIGRIGGSQLVSHILEKRDEWLNFHAADITEPLDKPLDVDSPLKHALEIFAETSFAFMPVASGGKIISSISIRDLLGVAADTDETVGPLASTLKTIGKDAGVIQALKFMVENRVRDLVALLQDGFYVINDRKILEFLLGHEARQLVMEKGFSALDTVPLSNVGFIKGKSINPKESTRVAASLLSGVNTPCIFVGDKILTPWDLVMK